jgi:hypothetical protein
MNSEAKKIYRVDIPVQLDIEQAVKHLPFGSRSQRLEAMFRELAEKARALARPQAVYQVSHARVIDSTTVDIDGHIFTSKILSKLLADQDRVIPFITTIGQELDEMRAPPRDMMRQFCLDAIKTVVLISAVDYLTEYLKEKCNIPHVALMNPGELEDWPITEQRPLFALFGEAVKQIGVSLTAGGAMKPIKSRSGLVFPNDTGFLSCRLCTQLNCPGRKAEYSPETVKEFLG